MGWLPPAAQDAQGPIHGNEYPKGWGTHSSGQQCQGLTILCSNTLQIYPFCEGLTKVTLLTSGNAVSTSTSLGTPRSRRFSQGYGRIGQKGLQDSLLRLLCAAKVCGRGKEKKGNQKADFSARHITAESWSLLSQGLQGWKALRVLTQEQGREGGSSPPPSSDRRGGSRCPSHQRVRKGGWC